MMRKNKYGVATKDRRTFNGEVFDSLKEMRYAQQLEQLKSATDPYNRVESFQRQIPFTLTVNDQLICKYVLDFKVQYCNGRIEYVDVKGMKTPVYRLKKKMMKIINGIEIKEV
jgi:hypothetical protein